MDRYRLGDLTLVGVIVSDRPLDANEGRSGRADARACWRSASALSGAGRRNLRRTRPCHPQRQHHDLADGRTTGGSSVPRICQRATAALVVDNSPALDGLWPRRLQEPVHRSGMADEATGHLLRLPGFLSASGPRGELVCLVAPGRRGFRRAVRVRTAHSCRGASRSPTIPTVHVFGLALSLRGPICG